MGVQGLTKIINCFSHILLETKNIKNMKVVVDGDSLVYFLYEKCQKDLKKGGNYDEYAAEIFSFFSALTSCNVKPYVVFDGSYEVDKRKHETTVNRASQRIQTVLKGEFNFAPLLSRLTLQYTLNEMQIPFVVCDHEADHDIAVLANQLKCPVVARDSDFFIYSLNKGYIPLYTINYSTDKCTGKIYYASNMCNVFPGLNIQTLPLLAVALGNDYVQRDNLTRLHKSLKGRSKDDDYNVKKLSYISNKVVKWVNSTPFGIVVSEFKKYAPDRMTYINMSIKLYTTVNSFDKSDFDIFTYFTGTRHECNGALKQKHRTGYLLPFIQNICQLKEIFLLCQAEDVSRSRSIHRCSNRLRRAMYALLFGEQNIVVLEYDRLGGSLVRFMCSPLQSLEIENDIPRTAKSMTKKEKLSFLCRFFRFSDINDLKDFCGNTKLLVLILTYWVKHAKPRVNHCFLKCIVLCHIGLMNRKMCVQPQNSVSTILSKWTRDSLDRACLETRKYFKFNITRQKRIVHGFTQFQSCFLYGCVLNDLLDRPVDTIRPQDVFNGTFLHNLYERFERYEEDDVTKKFKRFFMGDNNLENLFLRIVEIVKSNVIPDRYDGEKPRDVNMKERQKEAKIRGTFAMFNVLGMDDVPA